MKTHFKPYALLISAALIQSTPHAAIAVDTTDFSKPQMKEWAIEFNQMQECLTQLDEMEVIQYDEVLNRLQNQLTTLCQTGKGDEAQNQALAFNDTVKHSASYQKIQACGSALREHGFMPPLPIIKTDNNNQAIERICDRYAR